MTYVRLEHQVVFGFVAAATAAPAAAASCELVLDLGVAFVTRRKLVATNTSNSGDCRDWVILLMAHARCTEMLIATVYMPMTLSPTHRAFSPAHQVL